MVAQKGDTGRHNNDHGTEMASQTAGTTRTQWKGGGGSGRLAVGLA